MSQRRARRRPRCRRAIFGGVCCRASLAAFLPLELLPCLHRCQSRRWCASHRCDLVLPVARRWCAVAFGVSQSAACACTTRHSRCQIPHAVLTASRARPACSFAPQVSVKFGAEADLLRAAAAADQPAEAAAVEEYLQARAVFLSSVHRRYNLLNPLLAFQLRAINTDTLEPAVIPPGFWARMARQLSAYVTDAELQQLRTCHRLFKASLVRSCLQCAGVSSTEGGVEAVFRGPLLQTDIAIPLLPACLLTSNCSVASQRSKTSPCSS